MNWLRIGAIAVFLIVIVTAGLFTILTPNSLIDSADEPDVIQRVNEANGIIDGLEFSEVTMVGDRVLVKSTYVGNDTIQPESSAEWHRLAETSAERIYQEVVRNRGVEVQIYQENNLRSVAVAGL